MPQISDRGLRYVLHWLSKGNRATAATYLADEFSTGRGAGSALRGLEEEAEAFERREYDSRRKAQLEERRAEEDKNRRDAELEVVKKKIVGRYADQVGPRLESYACDRFGEFLHCNFCIEGPLSLCTRAFTF